MGRSDKNILRVPSDCAGQVGGGEGTGAIIRAAGRGGASPQCHRHTFRHAPVIVHLSLLLHPRLLLHLFLVFSTISVSHLSSRLWIIYCGF